MACVEPWRAAWLTCDRLPSSLPNLIREFEKLPPQGQIMPHAVPAAETVDRGSHELEPSLVIRSSFPSEVSKVCTQQDVGPRVFRRLAEVAHQIIGAMV